MSSSRSSQGKAKKSSKPKQTRHNEKASMKDTSLGMSSLCRLEDISETTCKTTSSVEVLVTNKELREISNASHLFQADVTDGSSRARLIAWGPVANFYNNKIFVGTTYKFLNLAVRKTPPQYIRNNYIPFDLTLTSGATIEISSNPIVEPDVVFLPIGDITKYINKRVNILGVIIDYDPEVTSTYTSKGASVARRSITVADEQFKIKVTLWADTAETWIPLNGQAVCIENALVKAYGTEVSLSCDKIRYADQDDPKAKKLIKCHENKNTATPIKVLTKHRLDNNAYKSVDLQDLETLENNTTVKTVGRIQDVTFETYSACEHCKTGVITMDTESFCPKCSKTVSVLPRYTFTLNVESFQNDIIVFHDNCSSLLDIKEFESEENRKQILSEIINTTYDILILKRLNRRQELQFVALDFQQTTKPKHTKDT